MMKRIELGVEVEGKIKGIALRVYFVAHLQCKPESQACRI